MAESTNAKIQTLYSDKDKSEILVPRTLTKSVYDDNGKRLDTILGDQVTFTLDGTILRINTKK